MGSTMRHGRHVGRRAPAGLIVLVLFAFSLAGTAGRVSASVTAIDLGTLGGSASEAWDTNADGQVVGWSETSDGSAHAFSWTPAGGMVDLGTLGGASSRAVAVNAGGQVVGWSEASDGSTHAFSWTGAGGMVDLGLGVAAAVNAGGQVVGWGETQDGSVHAFSWTEAGGMVDLGLGKAAAVNAGGQVVGQDGSASAFSWTGGAGKVNLGPGAALAVSDSGQAVGRIRICSPVCCHETCFHGACVCKWLCSEACRTEAFSWTQAGGRVGLGTLGGDSSWPTAVNIAGQVVGTSETADGSTHALLWTRTGGMIDLGTLGGAQSEVGSWDRPFHYAVNAAGQVVGTSETADGSFHGFSWTQTGGMVDLGTLGGAESSAFAVNNRGDVVGFSTAADGYRRATLWKLKPLVVTPLTSIFGKVLKDTGSERTIHLKNSGAVPLTVTGIGSPDPPFSITGGTCELPLTIPAGEECTLNVAFSPRSQEPASSQFTVSSDNPVADSVTANLTGRGVLLVVRPDEVTIGSEITLQGAGFGESKGKALIGGVAPKITWWTDSEIKGTLGKVPALDLLSDVVVQPRVPKGSPPITEPAGVIPRGLEIESVDPPSGVSGGPGPVAIRGRFFSTREGKVLLERGGVVKSCRVLRWTMDPSSGESIIQFLVPPKLMPATDYTLKIFNSVGSDTAIFTVNAP
jgi:probable HAF family extracellular repeat protein